jgi:imidazolonepropionase-like amidohydrolase
MDCLWYPVTVTTIVRSLTPCPASDSVRTGRIAKDMKADLVILSADPVHAATAFFKVRFTIRKGKVLYKER